MFQQLVLFLSYSRIFIPRCLYAAFIYLFFLVALFIAEISSRSSVLLSYPFLFLNIPLSFDTLPRSFFYPRNLCTSPTGETGCKEMWKHFFLGSSNFIRDAPREGIGLKRRQRGIINYLAPVIWDGHCPRN